MVEDEPDLRLTTRVIFLNAPSRLSPPPERRRNQEAELVARQRSGETESPRGRYKAEHVWVTDSPEAQLQEVLDAKESKEWHLVGVAGGFKEGGVVLFWDTARPSFGRRAP